MASNRTPGPANHKGPSLSSGTLSLSADVVPGPLTRLRTQRVASIAPAIEQLNAEAYEFAGKHIADGTVRAKYLAAVATCTKKLQRLCTRNASAAAKVKPVVDKTGRQLRQLNELVGVGPVAAVYRLLLAVREDGGPIAIELADPGFSKRSEQEKRNACLKAIEPIATRNTQFLQPAEIGKRLLVATRCLAWTTEVVRMPEVFQFRPVHTVKRTVVKSPAKPQAQAVPVRRAEPAAPKKAPPDNVDQKAQAATLIAAAKDGVPFCEECEKAKQEREASAEAAAS